MDNEKKIYKIVGGFFDQYSEHISSFVVKEENIDVFYIRTSGDIEAVFPLEKVRLGEILPTIILSPLEVSFFVYVDKEDLIPIYQQKIFKEVKKEFSRRIDFYEKGLSVLKNHDKN